MTRFTVLYERPENPAEFDRYYREVHVPLALKMQGLRGFTIGKCESSRPGEEPAYYMTVSVYADSREDLEKAFNSPEGQATLADVKNFAPRGVKFLIHEEEVILPVTLSK